MVDLDAVFSGSPGSACSRWRSPEPHSTWSSKGTATSRSGVLLLIEVPVLRGDDAVEPLCRRVRGKEMASASGTYPASRLSQEAASYRSSEAPDR